MRTHGPTADDLSERNRTRASADGGRDSRTGVDINFRDVSKSQGSASSELLVAQQRVSNDEQTDISSSDTAKHTLTKLAPKISTYIIAAVRMYNVLGRRAQQQAMMLRRTLRYSISGKNDPTGRTCSPTKKQARCKVSVAVTSLVFNGGNNQPSTSPPKTQTRDVSLIVAATYHPQDDYGDDANVHCICAASMLHVSMDKLGDELPEVSLDIPPEATNKKLRLLCLIWEEHMDLRLMSRKQGKSLSTGVRKLSSGIHHIFGLVPNHSRCRWSLTSFPKDKKECVTQLHKGGIYLDALAADADLHIKHARICLSRACQGDLSWPLDDLGNIRACLCFRWTKNSEQGVAMCRRPGTSAAAVAAQSSSTIFHFMPTKGNVASFTEITRNWECPMCGLHCTHFAALGMHLQASHDMFRYIFNGTGQDCMPEVWVRGSSSDPRSTHFSTSFRFPKSGHSLFHDTASKEFIYSKSAHQAERRHIQRRKSSETAALPSCVVEDHNSDQDMTEPVARLAQFGSTRDGEGGESNSTTRAGKSAKHGKLTAAGRKGFPRRQAERPLKTACRQTKDKAEYDGKSESPQPERRRLRSDSLGGNAPSVSGPPVTADSTTTATRQDLNKSKRARPPSSGKSAVGGSSAKPPASRRRLPPQTPEQRQQMESLRHNIYFHSRNCQAMSLAEVLSDRDSDDDFDEEECVKTNKRLLEHCPSNPTPDEQQLMLMWNVHVAKNPIHSDALTSSACRSFAEIHAKQLSVPELRRQFVMHLVNLLNFRLVSPAEVDECLQIIDAAGDP